MTRRKGRKRAMDKKRKKMAMVMIEWRRRI